MFFFTMEEGTGNCSRKNVNEVRQTCHSAKLDLARVKYFKRTGIKTKASTRFTSIIKDQISEARSFGVCFLARRKLRQFINRRETLSTTDIAPALCKGLKIFPRNLSC